jgi:malonyl-CoA/methylmalonyl-CoA synthetase
VRISRVNHLGVIVDDMDAAVAGFRDRLGLPLAKTEVYADMLDIAFLPCGDTQVELICPREHDDPAAHYLREHGPGIQHIAFEVDDLEAALAELRERGVEPLGEAPRPGADDTIIAFLDPRSFGGILVELCQPTAGDARGMSDGASGRGEWPWAAHLDEPVDRDALVAALRSGSLAREFAATAASAADRPALTIGALTYTHGELDRRAALLGGWLARNGLRAGDLVLIAGRTSHELVAAYLGTLRCGATAVPVDAGSTAAELEALVDDAQPAAAFCDGGAGAALAALPDGRRPGLLLALDGDGEGLPVEDALAAGEQLEPAGAAAPAILAFTSGTTGAPKGVPLSHANVLASIRAVMMAWRWERDEVLLHALPLSHQHGLGGLHATLLAGSHAVLEPRFDPAGFCERASAVGATAVMAVPTMWERLDAWDGGARAALARLRIGISGSAPLPAALALRVRDWLGQLPLERYGSTEAGLVLSNPLRGERKPGSVGYPLPGIEVRIVDAGGTDVAPGVDGELVVRGPQVFDGYLRRPRETEEAFTADGWFRSGDIARQDPSDGSIAITGRGKDMIITGGLNVFPREVEAALEAHAAVSRSAVVGVPSERWGEEVVGFVVGRAGATPDPEELIAHCRERLSGFKCPKRVIVVDGLPTNEMGKVRREELTRMAQQGGVNGAGIRR